MRDVLEVIGGTARKLGIEPGDRVTARRFVEPGIWAFRAGCWRGAKRVPNPRVNRNLGGA